MLPVTSFPLDLVWLSVTLLLVLTPCTLTHRSRRTMLSSKPLIDMKSQLGSSDSIRSARVSLASFHPGAFNFSTVRWSPGNYFFLKQISLTLPLIRIATMSLAWGQIAACQSDESPLLERKRMLCPCLPAWPAWPTTRKQTKCTDETLPLKISFNLLPCNKRLLEWLFWVQITEYQKQEGNKNALRKVRLSSLWSKNAKLATNLSWMTSLSQNGKMPTQFLCPESVPYPFGGWLHKKESLFDTFH